MINFFRKTRQKLLSENRFTKYLLYALGEIVLVVIGILIALSINNWNSDRLARNEEQVILKQLKAELALNKDQLNSKIERRENVIRAGMKILDWIDHPEMKYEQRTLDSLIFSTIPNFTFDPADGMMKQLNEGGKLSLIENEELRLLLSNWSSILVQVKEEEGFYSQVNLNDYRPFLYRNLNYRNISAMMGTTGLLTPVYLSEDNERLDLGLSLSVAEYSTVMRSTEFEGLISAVVKWNSVINIQSQGVLDYIDEAMVLVEREIKTQDE